MTEQLILNRAIIHGMADLVLAIGDATFFDKLTYLLKTAASFDDYVILIYHPSKSPTVLSSSFATDDFYHSAYYEDYFRQSKLIDETGFCVQGSDDNVYLLSLGRTKSLAKFSDRVLNLLWELSPVLSSAVKKHDSQRPIPERASHQQVKEYLLHFGGDMLTPREHDVMQLLIRGYSSKEAAKLLHISYETDRVHRKNIYQKLQVNSQHELLAKIFDDIVNLSPQAGK